MPISEVLLHNAAMGNRPRILQIITKADVGGAQQHVLQIMRELGERIEFVLLTGEDDYLTRQANRLGLEVIICPELVRPIQPWKDIRALMAIFRVIQRLQPDLVHLHSFKAGLLGRLAARLASRRSLFTAHGWSFTSGVPLPRRLLGLVLEWIFCRIGNAVVTISRHDFELAEKYSVGHREQRDLVLNAADEIHGPSETRQVFDQLVTVGRLTPVKNQAMMIKALACLPENLTLTVVGEGVEGARLERLCQELGVSERVRFLGKVTDLHQILASSDLFLLSSDFEGLPLSILEAMSAGLPVVATDVGGVSEAVAAGETGLLSPRRDSQRFAENIKSMLEDPGRAREMGQLGRERYHEAFTVARFVAEMERIYQKLLPSSYRR